MQVDSVAVIIGRASRVGESFTLAARRFIPTAVAGSLGGKVPEVDAFDPVYPNPFNRAVVLPFRLSRDSRVELAIYNALGQREALLVQGRLGAGEHRVRWEGASAASGNYLAVLNVDGKMRMRQLALIK